MVTKWKTSGNRGVRYYEHLTRKHGIKKDRYYAIRYTVDRKQIEEGLGWGSEGMTEQEAVEIRAELIKNRRNAEGPRTLAEKRTLNNKILRAKTSTIEEVFNEFWEVELSKQKSGAFRRRLLQKDVVSVWSKKKVTDIKRRDIVLLLDNIEKRSSVTRNRVHGTLSRFFNFAAERGIIEDSPCTRIKKPKEMTRTRVLTDDEIRMVWLALSTKNKIMDIYVITKLAIKLILLTGQRPGEITGMTWDELYQPGFWTIPAERMKGAEVHQIPLCPMATMIIEQTRVYSVNNNPYVFRSSYKENAPVTRAALSRAVLRHWKIIGIQEPFTPHDLRRTVRTRLAELGIEDIVAERVIGHKLQGVLGIYNRHDYTNEKQQALAKWEKKLEQIVCNDSLKIASHHK